MDSIFAEYSPLATFDDGSCPATLYGCMVPTAANYRSYATHARNTECEYAGCLSEDAFNFDPSATRPGTCIDKQVGCMDSGADNFADFANVPSSSSCLYEGCMDEKAPNFNPTATHDDSSCQPFFEGCTDSRFLNYYPHYNWNDGSCSKGGCMTEGDENYDTLATWYNGGCSGARRRLTTAGCMDPASGTYDQAATRHVHSDCIYEIIGCTDSTAKNHLAIATYNAGCSYAIPGCTIVEGTLNYDSTANTKSDCVYALPACTDSGATQAPPTPPHWLILNAKAAPTFVLLFP